ncbi:nucleotide exchange factor GrpE [Mangrovactinospora gilvigrisea]|uniref:Nucleotide exchange factor GrpE n=1 Tax=Mangrovactinospora gilvigrisea TaxID=1428644 RepID=A0A1J7BCZ7_9ACTN|nr:nucleotide exchange factor GrpE [Mangrovactinospora gilvigrisea]OIV36563.1 nucleotide exchange factor GrpE [Mangrovactinospora gilvigrisea]
MTTVPEGHPEPQPDAQPEAHDPFAVVADALDGVRAELAETNDRIGRRLLADRERRAGVDALQSELSRTRDMAEGRVLQPLLYDLVLLLDRVEREPATPFTESVRIELLTLLEKYGLRRLSEEDGPFDPSQHEAVATVPAESPEQAGTVAETFRPGYAIDSRIIRPRQVSVYTAEKAP